MGAPSSSSVPVPACATRAGAAPLRAWIAHGFRCVLLRAPLYGAVNGYVQVPRITDEQAEQVSAHGGVTYGPDVDGWIGFDTLHAGDVWPNAPHHWHGPGSREWTEDDVAKETERMAASAKAVIEQ
jgi:hypothetical protein